MCLDRYVWRLVGCGWRPDRYKSITLLDMWYNVQFTIWVKVSRPFHKSGDVKKTVYRKLTDFMTAR